MLKIGWDLLEQFVDEIGLTTLLTCLVGCLFMGWIKGGRRKKRRDGENATKLVVITGCDTGFGKEVALKLASINFKVIACCLNPQCPGAISLKETYPYNIVVVKLDLLNKEDISNMRQLLNREFSQYHVWALVNNAARTSYISSVLLTPDEIMTKYIEVNLYGGVRMVRMMVERMVKGARVVNISSLTASIHIKHLSMYCASKAALEAFSNCLRQELIQEGIKVCVVKSSGYVTESMHESVLDEKHQEVLNTLEKEWNEKELDKFERNWINEMEKCKKVNSTGRDIINFKQLRDFEVNERFLEGLSRFDGEKKMPQGNEDVSDGKIGNLYENIEHNVSTTHKNPLLTKPSTKDQTQNPKTNTKTNARILTDFATLKTVTSTHPTTTNNLTTTTSHNPTTTTNNLTTTTSHNPTTITNNSITSKTTTKINPLPSSQQSQLKHMQENFISMSSRSCAKDFSAVLEAIGECVMAEEPKTIYYVGRGSFLLSLLFAFLPTSLLDWLLR